MLSYGNTSKYFHNLVRSGLRQRFLEKEVVFSMLLNSNPPGSDNIQEYDKDIMAHFTSGAIKILEQFGRFIRTLQFRFTDDTEAIATIYDLLQEQCSESLRHLTLKGLKKTLVLNRPFTKVETLNLGTCTFGVCNVLDLDNKFNLNETFPALRSLHIDQANIFNSSGIGLHFPHLEHLNLHVNSSEILSESSIAELMTENPQITRLRLDGASSDLLQVVADVNVNLQQLEIRNYRDFNHGNVHMHFENVDNFTMTGLECKKMPSYMTFGPNLRECELNFFRMPSDGDVKSFIDFLENNKNLEIFRLNQVILTDAEFSRLAAIETNLIELSVYCSYRVNNGDIVKLIENNKKLERIDLTIFNLPSEIGAIVEFLRDHCGQEWVVSHLAADDRHVSLVRRK